MNNTARINDGINTISSFRVVGFIIFREVRARHPRQNKTQFVTMADLWEVVFYLAGIIKFLFHPVHMDIT